MSISSKSYATRGDTLFSTLIRHTHAKVENLYRHDFAMADDIRLRDALQTTDHEWVLSYDDVPEIRALYSPWALIERIPVIYSITGARRGHELLIRKRDWRNKSRDSIR